MAHLPACPAFGETARQSNLDGVPLLFFSWDFHESIIPYVPDRATKSVPPSFLIFYMEDFWITISRHCRHNNLNCICLGQPVDGDSRSFLIHVFQVQKNLCFWNMNVFAMQTIIRCWGIFARGRKNPPTYLLYRKLLIKMRKIERLQWIVILYYYIQLSTLQWLVICTLL